MELEGQEGDHFTLNASLSLYLMESTSRLIDKYKLVPSSFFLLLWTIKVRELPYYIINNEPNYPPILLAAWGFFASLSTHSCRFSPSSCLRCSQDSLACTHSFPDPSPAFSAGVAPWGHVYQGFPGGVLLELVLSPLRGPARHFHDILNLCWPKVWEDCSFALFSHMAI